METTLLSSKGQVIIPKAIRDHYHWQPGIKLVVEETQAGVLLKPANMFPPTEVQSGLGCSGYHGPAKTIDEMQEAIDSDLKRRWRKGQDR